MAYSAGNLELSIKALSDDALKSIDKLDTKLASLSASLGAISKNAQSTGKKLGGIMKSASGKGGGFNFGRLLNLAVIRRFAFYMADIVQYGTDFTETLNLWQVAMRENLDQADEFIKKMNKAYSVSQKTLMNAQAIFKNMIGSLGNISDTVSYQLSESILQMALDFSSLYNTTFENAITKFQAVLAGQVRPIRSVSGYDITETTLYQVYQELGGTKTQRQLNRTEKQLLAIYAVFQQMQRSGAVGDLSKTLDNFANQSRMMTENFKELQTYVGLFFQELLQSWGVLKYINAGLIFVTEIVKALTKYEAPNFIEGMFESTTAENEALDELQGKLLDFDKFRALDSTAGMSDLAIDQSILNAVSDYQSILENVNNEARELATKWLKDIGLLTVDENGNLTISDKKLKDIESTLKGIAVAVGVIFGYNLVNTVVTLITKIATLTNAMSLLNTVMVGGIIFSFVKLAEAVENGDEKAQALWGTISGALIPIWIALNWEMIKTTTINIAQFFSKIGNVLSSVMTPSLAKATAGLKSLNATVSMSNVVFGAMLGVLSFIVFDGLLNSLGEDARRVVAPILLVVGAVTALTAALLAMQGVITWGTALPVLLASIGAAVAGVKAMLSPQMYAVGASDIDSGTLFWAGENNMTEAVFNGSNGKTNVANVSQMEEAFYGALVRYGRENRGSDGAIVVQIDGERIFTATRRTANKRGLDFSRI